MKNKSQKLIYLFLLILLLAKFSFAEAATLNLKPSSSAADIWGQFYVDVMLDPEAVSLNAIEGSIIYPPNLSFVRAEYGGSIVGPWIVPPQIGGDKSISFAGIMPAGFAGVIDPFHSSRRAPGFVARLVFEATSSGEAQIEARGLSATQNDGIGTLQELNSLPAKISVTTFENPSTYKTEENTNPEIRAEVTRDPNLYNNRYTLVFEALDRGAGIKEVMVKEGNRPWKKINSPYLLEDQSRHSIIILQSSNFSGATVVTTIDPLPYKSFAPSQIVLAVILILFVFVLFKKIYARKKQHQK
jgi:hypothetical protein